MGLTVISIALCASHTSAQTLNRFALGVSFSTQHAPDDSSVAEGAHSVGVQWRIGHSKEGFGWQYALHWYSMEIDRLIGNGPTDLGTLRVRPLMGGYGYTHLFRGGKMAVTGDMVGGYAINSFRLNPAADSAYQTRLGARSVSAEAVNTLVAKPEVEMWYDVNKKVGVLVNAGYVFARPQVKVTSTLGRTFIASTPTPTRSSSAWSIPYFESRPDRPRLHHLIIMNPRRMAPTLLVNLPKLRVPATGYTSRGLKWLVVLNS